MVQDIIKNDKNQQNNEKQNNEKQNNEKQLPKYRPPGMNVHAETFSYFS